MALALRSPVIAVALVGAGLAAASLTGCATGYVLESHANNGFFRRLPLVPRFEETAAIPHVGNVALLYDRSDRVNYEDSDTEGGVWVHYVLNVKNAGGTSVQFAPRDAYLLAEAVEQVVREGGEGDGDKIQVKTSVITSDGKKVTEGGGDGGSKGKSQTVVENQKYPAVPNGEKGPTTVDVKGNAYVRVPVRFYLHPGALKKYGNDKLPMTLVLPLKGGKGAGDLKLSLWLGRIS